MSKFKKRLLVVNADVQGSKGFYPRSAVETIDVNVLPIGSVLWDTHVQYHSIGNNSYKEMIGKTISAPEFANESRGEGIYVDVEIFPDHEALLPKLDVVDTSMFLACEWKEAKEMINGKLTRVAKRFFHTDMFKNTIAVVGHGGTPSGFAVESAEFDQACIDGQCGLEQNCEILQVFPVGLSAESASNVSDEASYQNTDERIRHQFRKFVRNHVPNYAFAVDIDSDGFLIAQMDDSKWKVNYTGNMVDGYTFAPVHSWVEGDMSDPVFIPKKPVAAESVDSKAAEEKTPNSDNAVIGMEDNQMDEKEVQALVDAAVEAAISNSKQLDESESAKRLTELENQLKESRKREQAAIAKEAAGVAVKKFVVFKPGHEYNEELLVKELAAEATFNNNELDVEAMKAHLDRLTENAPFVASEDDSPPANSEFHYSWSAVQDGGDNMSQEDEIAALINNAGIESKDVYNRFMP